ncbi:MAG: Lrp/AsnC ligand binding domain-containing protein [Dehalococcoidales bacterium]|nr:Lrp/AsnC ligand binding domain-containing protein [Dehalococcoidales bacterium]
MLIKTISGKSKSLSGAMARNRILEAIGKVDGVLLAQAVTGSYEIIAMVEAKGLIEIGDIVTSKIASIPGIERWVLCVGIGQSVGCYESNALPAVSN